jgi:hypothetical protein
LGGGPTGLCDGSGNCILYDTRSTLPYCTAASVAAGLCGTLTYAPTPSAPNSPVAVGITLAGSVHPANGGQIGLVSSGLTVCTPSVGPVVPIPTGFSQSAPQACGANSSGLPSGGSILTGTGGASVNTSVTTGQTVAVTVVLTFGGS